MFNTAITLYDLWFLAQGAMAFLTLKGMAQLIYLVFDIARGVNNEQ